MIPKLSCHALQSYSGHMGRVKKSINEPNGAKPFLYADRGTWVRNEPISLLFPWKKRKGDGVSDGRITQGLIRDRSSRVF
jgi:hypothetical protein